MSRNVLVLHSHLLLVEEASTPQVFQLAVVGILHCVPKLVFPHSKSSLCRSDRLRTEGYKRSVTSYLSSSYNETIRECDIRFWSAGFMKVGKRNRHKTTTRQSQDNPKTIPRQFLIYSHFRFNPNAKFQGTHCEWCRGAFGVWM